MRLRGTSAHPVPVRRAAIAGGTSVLLAVALLTGCGDDEPSSAGTPVTTVPAATTTSVPAPTSTTTTRTETASPTMTTTPQPTKTRWPKALGEPQGDSAWAVYLAVAHSSSDPALKSAQDAVAKAGPGYGAVIGDLACDRGSIEALGLDKHDYWTGAVLYFSSKKDAEDFATSYLVEGGTVIGTAKIGLGCLD